MNSTPYIGKKHAEKINKDNRITYSDEKFKISYSLNKLSHYTQYDKDISKKSFLFAKKFRPEETITITIGDEKFYLPTELHEIAIEIESSKPILTFEKNWDEDGADSTNIRTFRKAVFFLISYAKYIKGLGEIIDTPFIDIMRDGSISIMWETTKAQFLIIFKKSNNEYSYFYGESKLTGIPFKYAVKNNEDVDEITALWMSKNLTI